MNIFRNWLHRDTTIAPKAIVEPVSDDQAQTITKMASTLSDLQDKVATVNTPAEKHFKLTGFLLAVVVAVVVAGSSFFAVTQFTKVGENSEQIDKNCRVRNEQVAIMNQKFSQLSILFDLAIKDQPPEERPTPEILRALEEFKKPIALINCKDPL